jgi:hypothetical protein
MAVSIDWPSQNQNNQSLCQHVTPPFVSYPFPLRRTSWYCSYHSLLLGTQYSNRSMHSHSGGQLGTIAVHSLDLHALTRHRLVLVGSCYLFSWPMLIATTTDYQFIHHSRGLYCWVFRLPGTLDDISSRGLLSVLTPTNSSPIHSSGPCGICTTIPRFTFTCLVVHSIGLPRTFGRSYCIARSLLLVATTTDSCSH